MAGRSPRAALQSVIDAIEHIESKLDGITLEAFQGDLDRRRIVERSVEIISEASRRSPEDLKERYPYISWKKVAGIGNVIRHDYENVVPDALWKLAKDDLPPLERICKAELMREKFRQTNEPT